MSPSGVDNNAQPWKNESEVVSAERARVAAPIRFDSRGACHPGGRPRAAASQYGSGGEQLGSVSDLRMASIRVITGRVGAVVWFGSGTPVLHRAGQVFFGQVFFSKTRGGRLSQSEFSRELPWRRHCSRRRSCSGTAFGARPPPPRPHPPQPPATVASRSIALHGLVLPRVRGLSPSAFLQ